MGNDVSERLYFLTRKRAFYWLEGHPGVDDFTRQVLIYIVDYCRGRRNAKSAPSIQYAAADNIARQRYRLVDTKARPVDYKINAEQDRRGLYATEVLTALREDPDGPRLPLVSSGLGWYVPENFEDMFIAVRQTRSRILRLKEKLGRLWATYKTVLEELDDVAPCGAEDIQGLLNYEG